MKQLILVLALASFLSASILAQSTNAALTGTVADTTQAVVPGAMVT